VQYEMREVFFPRQWFEKWSYICRSACHCFSNETSHYL